MRQLCFRRQLFFFPAIAFVFSGGCLACLEDFSEDFSVVLPNYGL